MAAYVVFDIDVLDSDAYQDYRRLGAPTVAAFGGRFLARAWYDSDGYREARRLRERAARTIGILVDGYVPAAGDPH
ncbi:DUF1330 domain-containing protein [Burkholderia ubonensis]|uniref:DUF1330 domain-containing protein n=1 Tax=Burkholderia ubonensis TaxID=101571 RepID=UPI00075BB6D6|nr:DUF1330 domain-containing protein [Burkholderia ubonensis]KWN72127.1 D-fructose-6-phosphate amidotransferase [Burkholderia ubonensis]